MRKLFLAFMPLFSLAQVYTKPYDDLKTGDSVVTAVTFQVSAPVLTVNGMTGDVVITASSLGALTSAPVVSVNGQTGTVTITAAGLGALTSAPVTSVNSQTGDVIVTAASLGVDTNLVNGALQTSATVGWTVSPHDAWIVATTGTNIAQYVVGLHDASMTAHQIIFSGKLDTTNSTYLTTVSLASTALQPSALDPYYPRNNPSNFVTLAQIPAQTQQVYVASAGTAVVVTGGQSNTIASALQSVDLLPYYPRNNPSNFVTLAQVPAQTNQTYVANAGHATTATTVTGTQSNLIASALQSFTELDPTVDGKITIHNTNTASHASLLNLSGTRPMTGTLTTPSINFTNGTTLSWNGSEDVQSLEYTHPDGGSVTINGEIYAMWKNIDTVAITNGQPVCLFAGAGRVGTIKRADADDPARLGMIGFYTGQSPLAVNAIGRITTFGIIHDAPLNGFVDSGVSEGAQLYLSTNAGHVTTNVPTPPTETIKVGFVNYVNPSPDKYDIQVAIENAKPWSVLDGRYLQSFTEQDLIALGALSIHSTNSQAHSLLFAEKVSTTDAGYLGAVAHTNLQTNPHNTTASQVGAVTPGESSNIVANVMAPAYNATLELTGFENPSLITMHYTDSTIVMTQTGGIPVWWRGVRSVIPSPYTSPAHDAGTGFFYLAGRTGTNFVWSSSPWTFDMIQVAYIHKDGFTVGFKECHGLMQWQSHDVLHRNVGCFRLSGLQPDPATYALNTNTDAANTPAFLEGYVQDEDLEVQIPATTEGKYSILYFTGTNTAIIVTNYPSMFRTNGVANSYAMVNTITGGIFNTNSVSQNGRWLNYYQIAMPVTESAVSQEYRILMLQPQFVYTSLATAQTEDFRALNLGGLSGIAAEMVAFTRFTVNTDSGYSTAGRAEIVAVSYLTGSKATQVNVSQLNAPNTANTISTSTAGFSNILSAADSTVQLALDTIDLNATPRSVTTDHTTNATIHITGAERISWNGKLDATNATYLTTVSLASTALQSFVEADPIWTAVSNTVTTGASLGATALQSFTESDPVWAGVSNTVTANALLGSTALQPSATNGWTTSAHLAWLLTESDPFLAIHATNTTAHSSLFALKADTVHNQAWATITNPPASIATALQPANTNGWVVSSHLDWLLASATNGWTVSAHDAWLLSSATNGWVVSSHSGFLTAESDPTVAGAISTHNTNATAHSDMFNAKASTSITNGFATIAYADLLATNPPPYMAFTGIITPANGTATVTYAHGIMPKLVLSGTTVITLDPTSYGTNGISRISLSLYSGANSVTLSTNVITYATTPTLSTNSWNSILIRRVASDGWKGVQL